MGIIDDLKSIGKFLQDAGKIEQYNQILETQRELLEMQKKINDLEKDNTKLKEKLEVKEKVFFKNGVYWIKKDDGDDGPFCTRCYDKNSDIIRMPYLRSSYGKPHWKCPECKTIFLTGEPDAPIITNKDSYI